MMNTTSVESILWDKLLMAQANDEGMKTIKQRLSQNDPKYTFPTRSKWYNLVWAASSCSRRSYPQEGNFE
jgi:hypothetical protein